MPLPPSLSNHHHLPSPFLSIPRPLCLSSLPCVVVYPHVSVRPVVVSRCVFLSVLFIVAWSMSRSYFMLCSPLLVKTTCHVGPSTRVSVSSRFWSRIVRQRRRKAIEVSVAIDCGVDYN